MKLTFADSQKLVCLDTNTVIPIYHYTIWYIAHYIIIPLSIVSLLNCFKFFNHPLLILYKHRHPTQAEITLFCGISDYPNINTNAVCSRCPFGFCLV